MTAPTAIRRLNAADPDFAHHLDHLLSWESVSDDSVNQRRAGHHQGCARARRRGAGGIHPAIRRPATLRRWRDLILPRERLELALTRITVPQREALEVAAARVRSYHEKQKQDSWSYTEADGTVFGQKVTPLDRAGLYVPGGKASYPSSVLMNAIPAKVAGVTEVVMVVPTPRGEINELVLAAALHRRRRPRVHHRRRASGRRAGLRHRKRADGRQDRRPGQHLCRHCQAPRVRPGRHRHDRRPFGNPRGLRRPDRSGLDRHGPVLPGRARRRRAGDSGQSRTPSSSTRSPPASTVCCRPWNAREIIADLDQ